jgi:hypothetical protein
MKNGGLLIGLMVVLALVLSKGFSLGVTHLIGVIFDHVLTGLNLK